MEPRSRSGFAAEDSEQPHISFSRILSGTLLALGISAMESLRAVQLLDPDLHLAATLRCCFAVFHDPRLNCHSVNSSPIRIKEALSNRVTSTL